MYQLLKMREFPPNRLETETGCKIKPVGIVAGG
jgi:hypothetical protein